MRNALVTGAARGFGFSLTRQFVDDGWRVFACAREAPSRDRLVSLRDRHPDRVTPVRLDVTSDRDRYRLRQLLRLETDSVDVVINNAGINAAATDDPAAHVELGTLDGDAMVEMFRVNTVAPLLIVQELFDLLVAADRPRVVNVSSRAGSIEETDTGGNYSYAASKAALNMTTRALAYDVGEQGVVVAVHPGRLQTRMGGPTAPDDPDDAAEELFELIGTLSTEQTGQFLTRTGDRIPW